MGGAGADAFTRAAIFGWSDIGMAIRCTMRWKMQSTEPSKQSQAEDKTTREIQRFKISRDTSVTNEKRQAVGSP